MSLIDEMFPFWKILIKIRVIINFIITDLNTISNTSINLVPLWYQLGVPGTPLFNYPEIPDNS